MKYSIGKIMSTTATVAGLMLLALVSLTTILYLYEDSRPLGDYFEYYGNVTTATEFTLPEEITSYAFGAAKQEHLNMDFISELWCTPHGSSQQPYLVTTATKHFDDFKFGNVTTSSGTAPIQDDRLISLIGSRQQVAVRTNADEDGYRAWSMDEAHPLQSSSCMIMSTVGTTTDIFKISKSIRFEGNRFDYIVPIEGDTE